MFADYQSIRNLSDDQRKKFSDAIFSIFNNVRKKVELPPQTVVMSNLTSQRLALEQLLLVPAQVALSVVAKPSGPQDLREWPPPLSVADRLSTLHRLNL